jgi:hypothetical protein
MDVVETGPLELRSGNVESIGTVRWKIAKTFQIADGRVGLLGLSHVTALVWMGQGALV